MTLSELYSYITGDDAENVAEPKTQIANALPQATFNIDGIADGIEKIGGAVGSIFNIFKKDSSKTMQQTQTTLAGATQGTLSQAMPFIVVGGIVLIAAVVIKKVL